MSPTSLRADDRELPVVDGGDFTPGDPWAPSPNGVRQVRHFRWRRDKSTSRDYLPGSLLSLAGAIIAASAVGAGYVAYESQRLFALAHVQGHHRESRAAIVAALPDAGWGSMALVALVAALRAQSSLRARVGVIIFFALSLAAQVMYAPRTDKGALDPKALLVAVIAPITLAWMLETFIVEVRRWVASRRNDLNIDESPIITNAVRGVGRGLRGAVGIPLWLIRLAVDRRGTWNGAKDWLLDELPLAPGRTRASLRAATAEQRVVETRQDADLRLDEERQQRARLAAENAELVDRIEELRARVEALTGTTSKERLIGLYETLGRAGDPRYGDRACIGEVARELFGQAGLRSEGTARAYLYEHIGVKEADGAGETADQGVMIGGKA